MRDYDLADHHDEIRVAVQTAATTISRQATAAMYFLAFLAVWTAVFFLALR
jgi:hypothetical protein